MDTTEPDLYIVKMNNYVSVEHRQIQENMRCLLSDLDDTNLEKKNDAALEVVIQG